VHEPLIFLLVPVAYWPSLAVCIPGTRLRSWHERQLLNEKIPLILAIGGGVIDVMAGPCVGIFAERVLL